VPAPPPVRPGASIFTIEGRSAPGLFVVGWLATILGAGIVAVALMSPQSSARTILFVVGLIPLAVGLIAGAGSQGIERRARGDRAYVGPSPFLVFAASIPVSLLALFIVSVPLELLGVDLVDGPGGALLSVLIQAGVYVGLIRLLVVDTGALAWAAMGIRRLDLAGLGQIAGGSVWAIPVIGITIPVAAVLQAFFPVSPVSPLPPTGTDTGFALSLLIGVIAAPLSEEIMFRGFMTTAWVRGMGVVRGVLLGAFVFAFAHVLTASGATADEAFGVAIVGFGTRVPVALALGWLFARRGTIWASFGLHAAFNGILLIIAEAAARST
jgi:membrane protease YdiL (CAAX protease family)